MTKLVSKNPVLRFKEGRKIVKAARGFNMSRLIRHGSGNSSSYTDANGNVVFLNGKMSNEAVKYMKSKGYSDSYINRTLENMRVGNVWDRNLKSSKNPYGRWRIDNGRSDSKWNNEILAEALKNRKDVRQEKNGQYSFRTASGKWKYLNEPIKQTQTSNNKSSETKTSLQSNSGDIYFRDDKGNIVGRRLDNGSWTYRAPVDYEWYSGLPSKNDDILQFTSNTPLTMDLYNQIRKLWNHYNSGFLDAFFRSSEKAAQNMGDWAVRAYGRTNNPNEYMNRLGLVFSTRESPYTKMSKVYLDIEKGLSQKLNSAGYTTYTPVSENAAGGFYKLGGSILKFLKGKSSPTIFMHLGIEQGWKGTVGKAPELTDLLKLQLINTGKFTNNDFTTAGALLTALNNYFGGTGGSISVDNKWGKLSQTALDAALAATKDPGTYMNLSLSLDLPNLDGTKTRTNIHGRYNITGLLSNKMTNPENIPTINLNNASPAITPQVSNVNLNRAQTRNLMRAHNLNPYNYSGAQRKALRNFYSTGNYDSNLLSGIISKDYKWLKQGGLISRNPVKQFKVNFRKEAL